MPQPLRTYKIITPRTLIRCYQAGDGALVKQAVDDSLSELLPFMTWAKFEPETIAAKEARILEFREKFLNGEDYTLGVFSHNETEVIASTGLHARHEGKVLEIGYWVNTKYAGQGLCTEVVNALTKVGFEVEGLDKLVIRCELGNLASQRVAQKCGYRFIELREAQFPNEKAPRIMQVYELTRDEYYALNSVININAYAQNDDSLM